MTEQFLIDWLAKEDASMLGECSGKTLDALVSKGLAEIGPAPQGRPREYARVRLTESGRAAATI